MVSDFNETPGYAINTYPGQADFIVLFKLKYLRGPTDFKFMLIDKVRAINQIYHDLEKEVDHFKKSVKAACIQVCSECCLNTDIEATILEFLPAAYYLYKTGRAEEILNRLNYMADRRCVFYDFKAGKKIAVVSDITIDELTDAPQRVQDNFANIPDDSLEILVSDTESRGLADKYIAEKAVSGKFYEDALHIAIATINQVNVLASWNFKHIVNLDKIRMYNSVNLKNGFSILEIRTPREILKFDDDEN